MTDDWLTLLADWTVVREGVRKDFQVKQRLYSGAELRELLVTVGFTGVRLFGSLDAKAPYDDAAERLVAIAQAPPGTA